MRTPAAVLAVEDEDRVFQVLQQPVDVAAQIGNFVLRAAQPLAQQADLGGMTESSSVAGFAPAAWRGFVFAAGHQVQLPAQAAQRAESRTSRTGTSGNAAPDHREQRDVGALLQGRLDVESRISAGAMITRTDNTGDPSAGAQPAVPAGSSWCRLGPARTVSRTSRSAHQRCRSRGSAGTRSPSRSGIAVGQDFVTRVDHGHFEDRFRGGHDGLEAIQKIVPVAARRAAPRSVRDGSGRLSRSCDRYGGAHIRAPQGGLELLLHVVAQIHAEMRATMRMANSTVPSVSLAWRFMRLYEMASSSLPAVLRPSRSRCAAAASASG